MITFGSLFAGIGGFDLAFERANMRCAWQVEIDAAARSVLSRHWPDVPKFADVRDVSASLTDRYGAGLDSHQVAGSEFASVDQAMTVGAENDAVCQCVCSAVASLNDVVSVADGFVPATPETGITMPAMDRLHPSGTGLVNTFGAYDVADAFVPSTAGIPLNSDICPVCKLRRAGLSGLVSTNETAALIGDTATPASASIHGTKYNTHSPKQLQPVDVICAGFPCQDLSVAGNRAGLAGARSGLFFEIVRIVREMREATNGSSPTFLVLENVPGLLNSRRGGDFAVVLRELQELGAIDIAWRVLDARYFGLAQRRRRVFVVADFRGERAAEVLFESEGVPGHPTPSREARQDVAGTLGGSSQSGGFRTTDLDNNGAFVPLARSLTTREGARLDGESCTFVPIAFDWQAGHGNDTSFKGKSRQYIVRKGDYTGSLQANKRDAVAVPAAVAFAENQRAEVRTSDVALNITNGGGKPGQGYPAVLAFQERGRDGGRNLEHQDDLAYSLNAPNGGGRRNEFNVATPMAVRRLTPTECERLQGFPDNWTAGQADSSRYRQLGNAVAVPCVEWIARRLTSLSLDPPAGRSQTIPLSGKTASKEGT